MKWVPAVLLILTAPQAGAQFLHCSPTDIKVPGLADITGSTGNLKFKYSGVVNAVNTGPNFVVVIPSSGVTPMQVQIGLNPAVTPQLAPGSIYIVLVQFTTVDLTPASTTGCLVTLTTPKAPPPRVQSVVNAASRQPLVSAGAQVSILGSNLTGPTLSTNYDATGSYPTTVAGTSVTFNGIAAPLLYLSPGKIKAIVPFALAGQTSVQVVVQRFNQVSDTFTLPLQETAPGIFTRRRRTGPGPILQQGADGQFSANSADNPAPAGTTLEIFATGAGSWGPAPQSDIFLSGASLIPRQVSVTVGGQPAKIVYAATSGTYNLWSVVQVNAVVPDGLDSGQQPIVLTIGENDNSQQQVTGSMIAGVHLRLSAAQFCF
jgi:uncharacterized protein (TIGR03437 family)